MPQTAKTIAGVVARLDESMILVAEVDQQPRAGTQVDPNSTVNLTIAEEGVRVPAVSGRSYNLQSAAQLLSQAGLRYSSSTQQTEQYPNDTVMSQSPSPGTSKVAPATASPPSDAAAWIARACPPAEIGRASWRERV